MERKEYEAKTNSIIEKLGRIEIDFYHLVAITKTVLKKRGKKVLSFITK